MDIMDIITILRIVKCFQRQYECAFEGLGSSVSQSMLPLMKIKSHAGFLMNERADELAEYGRIADQPELCPDPQKFGHFLLKNQDSVSKQAATCKKQLPRNSAPNESILQQESQVNILQAMLLLHIIFVTDLLHHKEGATVLKLTQLFKPAEYRVWLKCMGSIYPVQIYLHKSATR